MVNYETLYSAQVFGNTGIFLLKNPYARLAGLRNVPKNLRLQRVS